MNEILSKLQKSIKGRLSRPESLFWSYDAQDRGGEPFRVFLDMDYRGRSVTVEWRAIWGDNFGVSRLDDSLKNFFGAGHDFHVIGVDATITKVIELLEPSDAPASG